MKKLLITSLVVGGLLISNSVTAHAFSRDKGHCSKCEEKAQKCKVTKLKKKVKLLWNNKEDLKINEDQLTKIKDIKHKAIKELIQLKADKDIVMVDLDSAMRSDSIDVGTVNPLIDSKYAAKTKTAKVYVKAISDIQQVLTKDQRVKWSEMCKDVASKCSKCKKGKKCAKCAAGEGRFCPITGERLDGKGSSKGSRK